MLLLLYAQPPVKVVALPTSVVDDDDGMSITLDQHATDVPEPFAWTRYTGRSIKS